MKSFANLFSEIDASTKTRAKVKALEKYFTHAPDQDKLWTIALFSHKRPKRTISTTLLRTWAAEVAKIPTWLFEESYHVVGDLAESISLMVYDGTYFASDKTLTNWINNIQKQRDKEEEEKKEFVIKAWKELNQKEIFLFNKLITGGFRVGVSQKLITKALAKVLNQEENQIAHRLMGNWSPDTTTFESLLIDENIHADLSKPYPFYLAYAIEEDPASLGPISDWQAEYKWDGIRSQIIKRSNEVFLWSRGEELVTDSYPEFTSLKEVAQDGFTIDGELLVIKEGEIQSFNILQKRLGRKKVSKKMLSEYPCAILAYDLLEYEGEDIRNHHLNNRRTLLKELIQKWQSESLDIPIIFSDSIDFESWEQLKSIRSTSREKHAEGLMLKHVNGVYKIGRKKGEWWKWKVDPLTIDAVMLYAQRGHGRRSNLYSDFTFAVWNEAGNLIPFAKAYSGLTDKEFGEITKFVNQNTIERFGPVRSVKPELVFEIAFEGINESKRHKSGVALRFPRIKRWRKDKPASEADTLENLKSLLN